MLATKAADENLQSRLLGRVEQAEGRHGEDPHGIDPAPRISAKSRRRFPFQGIARRGAGAERAVSHTLHEIFGVSGKKNFAMNPDIAKASSHPVRHNRARRRRLQRQAVAIGRAHLARSRIAGGADWLKIVGRCVIAEFICHFLPKTKRLAEILSSIAETASRLRMTGSAFPGQRRTDDCVDIGMLRLPLEARPGKSRVGDELGRVTRAPCRLAERHRPTGDTLDRRDDLTHRTALPGAQGRRSPPPIAERLHMRVREIGH
jgi:hypothetical protein